MNRCRKLELRSNTAQGREQGQRFGIGTHFTQSGTPSVVLKNEIDPVIKTERFSLSQSDGALTSLLGRQIQHLRLASMQDQRAGQAA